MKNFEIAGYFKYANIRDTVPAASQKDALIQVLKKYNIEYKDLLKITNTASMNPINATGNWHVIL